MSGLPPGLSVVVVDVSAADDETAFAFHAALAARWATPRAPGGSGWGRSR
ncbi:DUF6207 family protein [Streptomyces sp. SCL15-6]|nr:DUF6207 family protein [Streptomyces sp. SCL15-6]